MMEQKPESSVQANFLRLPVFSGREVSSLMLHWFIFEGLSLSCGAGCPMQICAGLHPWTLSTENDRNSTLTNSGRGEMNPFMELGANPQGGGQGWGFASRTTWTKPPRTVSCDFAHVFVPHFCFSFHTILFSQTGFLLRPETMARDCPVFAMREGTVFPCF